MKGRDPAIARGREGTNGITAHVGEVSAPTARTTVRRQNWDSPGSLVVKNQPSKAGFNSWLGNRAHVPGDD